MDSKAQCLAIGMLMLAMCPVHAGSNNAQRDAVAPASANAERGGPVWDVLSLDSTGCADNGIGFTTQTSNIPESTPLRMRTIVDAGGLRYMDEIADPPENSTQPWNLYSESSGGFTDLAFPMPQDIEITVYFILFNSRTGLMEIVRRVRLDRCNGGSLTDNSIMTPQTEPLGWDIEALESVGCANNEVTFTTQVRGYIPATGARYRTQVDAGGLRYMDENAGTPSGNGSQEWALYDSSSAGPTTASFPLPTATPFTTRFTFQGGASDRILFQRSVTIDACDGGTIVSEFVAPTLFRDGFEP